MYYLGWVLLTPDTEDIEGTVEKLMAPYSEDVSVPPYKRYILDEETSFYPDLGDKWNDFKSMSEQYHTTDLSELATHVMDWKGCPGGVDEVGLYYLSTWNLKSFWDYYGIGGGWGEHDGKPNACMVSEIPPDTRFPFTIVTPDGLVHTKEKHERQHGILGENGEKADRCWKNEAKSILAECLDCICVTIDYHR